MELTKFSFDDKV